MTAKTIAYADQFAVVAKEHVAHPVAHSEPFAVVVSDDERGAVIVTAGAQGPSGIQGQIGPTGGSAFTREAGITISALTVVYENSEGVVFPLSNTDETNIDQLCGIAITAAAQGADITIQRAGPLDANGLGLSVGRVWLGVSGALTQLAPQTGFDVLIGYATAEQRIYIDLSDNIQLNEE